MENYEELSKQLFILKENNKLLEAQKKENNEKINEIQFNLLEMMESEGLEKFTTEFGTLSRKIEMFPQVDEDTGGFPAFLEWVVKGGAYEYLQRRINRAPIKQFYEENNILPPGVKTYLKESLSARINPGFRQTL